MEQYKQEFIEFRCVSFLRLLKTLIILDFKAFAGILESKLSYFSVK